MVFWGLVSAVVGVIAVLFAFLDSLNIFSDMNALGFGAWVARFFDPATLTVKKVVFYIAIVAVIVGLVLFIVGAMKKKKTGEHDKQTVKSLKFLRDLKGEFKKITWPTWPTVLRNTCVTLALCAILGLLIVLIDLGLSGLIRLLTGIG